jgi:hypothetical protein
LRLYWIGALMGERFNKLPTPYVSFTVLFITWMMYSTFRKWIARRWYKINYENVCNVIEYSSNKYKLGCRHPKVLLLFQDV